MIAGIAAVALVAVVVLVTGLTAFIFTDYLIVAVQHLDLILGCAVMATNWGPVPSDSARFGRSWGARDHRWFGINVHHWTAITTVRRVGVVLQPTLAASTHVVRINGLTLGIANTATITFVSTGAAADITIQATATTRTDIGAIRGLTLSVRGTRTVTSVSGRCGSRNWSGNKAG